ncbi:hypothetical protein BPO_0531 [Bergeyella porcorum]|uniref:Uncharacterized protein n=1 Tax=Bergeyella porcorum TaxID=1735111 RepID=A0AAU0F180_9FLAO
MTGWNVKSVNDNALKTRLLKIWSFSKNGSTKP